ncbi:glycerophosphodiester phosphodiesterase [Ornithinibacillus halophilus]|uniref:Glycerophosphoryl diester phosphodiesterase n=1 Tax=Ornithinibacillus halophilus TaxID=930117 RepID=A0A1M5HMX4_9BACI|nr:glycerophosphodiester phosphodiesterase family protein [Ornithinibacillus halophilus]SHG17182.1 glycerophosphoryl diester phosphodiesterase [Ornithinibacillus halophilus]
MIINFAHRGSLTEAPENSLPAIKKAIEHGAKAIELDVQLSKDNHLVVIHDHHFKRFNPSINGLVRDYTLAEIKNIDIGSSFSKEFEGTSLTTLEEVLEICPEDTLLNIEIKNIPVIYEGIEEILVNCLRDHNRFQNIIISSFDHHALQKVQALEPSLKLGLLIYYRMVNPWEYAKNCGLNLTSVHPLQTWTDQQFIEEFHNLGLKVYPFTVNEEKRYKELIDLGVDGVFSNTPSIFTP